MGSAIAWQSARTSAAAAFVLHARRSGGRTSAARAANGRRRRDIIGFEVVGNRRDAAASRAVLAPGQGTHRGQKLATRSGVLRASPARVPLSLTVACCARAGSGQTPGPASPVRHRPGARTRWRWPPTPSGDDGMRDDALCPALRRRVTMHGAVVRRGGPRRRAVPAEFRAHPQQFCQRLGLELAHQT